MSATRSYAIGLGVAAALAAWCPASRGQAPAQGPGQNVPSAGPGAADGAPGALTGQFGAAGGINPLMILLAPAVQEELKLDEAQKTKVYQLARDSAMRSRNLMRSVLGPNTNPQALMEAGTRLRQENDKAIASALKPEQKERLNQIVLQAEGPPAVARPEVAAKLGLSPVQSRQVQAIVFQMTQAQLSMAHVDPTAAPAQPGSQARVRAMAGQQIGRVLTAKQKEAFNAMLGAPFDLAKIDPDLAAPSGSSNDSGDNAAPSPRRKRGGAGKKAPSKGATEAKRKS